MSLHDLAPGLDTIAKTDPITQHLSEVAMDCCSRILLFQRPHRYIGRVEAYRDDVTGKRILDISGDTVPIQNRAEFDQWLSGQVLHSPVDLLGRLYSGLWTPTDEPDRRRHHLTYRQLFCQEVASYIVVHLMPYIDAKKILGRALPSLHVSDALTRICEKQLEKTSLPLYLDLIGSTLEAHKREMPYIYH